MSWLTAAELAGLQGLPTSERRTREWLVRIGIPSRVREGREGGGGREFDASALPAETRKALLARQVQQAPAPGVIEAVPAAASFEIAPAAAPQLPATQKTDRRPPSKADAACADGRVQVVQAFISMAASMGGVTRAAAALSSDLAAADCSAELLAAAAAANARPRSQHGGVSISARTLFSWHAAHLAEGWWGLLPKPVTAKPVTELGSDVAAVLQAYSSAKGSARNLTEVTQAVNKLLGRPHDDWRRLYDQARRALPKLDAVQLIKARHTGSDRSARLPFKRRGTENLLPLDVGIIDGHGFKAKVRHPEHGQPFKPEVSLVLDGGTRKVTGWSASLSESTMAVGAAVCHSAQTHGIHAVMYSDNGAGETGKQLDCPLAGLYARLGTHRETGLPGNAQGRGLIERSWRTHMIRCARQFETFNGGGADEGTLRKVTQELAREQRAVDRARKTQEVVTLSRRVPTWREFLAAVDQAISDYNNQHRHRSLPKHQAGPHAGLHMTPQEAWDAMLVPEMQSRPSPAEARLLFMPAKLCTAQRGEVQFLTLHYFNAELMQVEGERVSVRYDIHNPSTVWVWRTSGEFVCEAKLDANRSDYFPRPVIEMAREKRVKGMVKRAQARIDTAERELGPMLAEGDQPSYLTQAAMAPAGALQMVERLDTPPAAQAEPARRLFDTPSDRYEWLMTHRDAWADADAGWLTSYAAGDDYAALAEYYAERGLAWDAAALGFKSAG